MINTLEETVNQLNKNLDMEISARSELNIKCNSLQAIANEFETSYKCLESSYQTALTKAESLSTERLQVLKNSKTFSQKSILKFFILSMKFSSFLSSAKKLFSMSCETNFALLLTKIQQLKNISIQYAELEQEKNENTNLFNKQIISFKEQLANKDIHMELYRKKIVDLEGGTFGKSELKQNIDDHILTIKKMKIKIEKLNNKIDILNNENIKLKAQLLDITTLQVFECNNEKLLIIFNKLI